VWANKTTSYVLFPVCVVVSWVCCAADICIYMQYHNAITVNSVQTLLMQSSISSD